MTLKEKFFNWYPKQDAEFISEECEIIADEFAIGFAAWCIWNEADKSSTYSFKELLEIYKKEKGL